MAKSLTVCAPCHGDAVKKTENASECEVCQLKARNTELEAIVAKMDSDRRACVMLIGDSQLMKLRKAPHYMNEYFGNNTPRMLVRWQINENIERMLAYLLESFKVSRPQAVGFHVLWFGGLHDTTLEDYDRSKYLERLKVALKTIHDDARSLSVTWATLPESAHNAEAAHINEEMVRCSADTEWLKILDLRFVSRREGTMDANEAIWTTKGSQCVFESLKKFFVEKLEYTDEELSSLEESAKKNREKREKREAKQVKKSTAATGVAATTNGDGPAKNNGTGETSATNSAPKKKKVVAQKAQKAAENQGAQRAQTQKVAVNKKFPPVEIRNKPKVANPRRGVKGVTVIAQRPPRGQQQQQQQQQKQQQQQQQKQQQQQQVQQQQQQVPRNQNKRFHAGGKRPFRQDGGGQAGNFAAQSNYVDAWTTGAASYQNAYGNGQAKRVRKQNNDMGYAGNYYDFGNYSEDIQY